MKNNNYIYQTEYKPSEAAFYETIFVLSNGQIGIRPTIEFKSDAARPGIFINGIYDYALTVRDQIVNAPTCMDFSLIIDGQLINLDINTIIGFRRTLDLLHAILFTEYSVQLSNERIVKVEKEEFLNQENVYHCKTSIICNFDTHYRVEHAINYGIGNDYHGGYINQDIKSFHTKLLEYSYKNGHLDLEFQTTKSQKKIYYRSKMNACNKKMNVFWGRKRVGFSNEGFIRNGSKTTFLFELSISTSKYINITENYSFAQKKHFSFWENVWRNYPSVTFKDEDLDTRMKYSLYQCLTSYSKCLPEGANIPPRGLSSGYHHGHFFFNTELYMVPFFTWIQPDYAKSLLFYRINTISDAKETAKSLNYKGVFWSEESGIDGKPAGPTVIKDFIKDEVYEEWTGRKVKHLPLDVLYASKKYIDISGDIKFEKKYIVNLAREVVDYCLSIISKEESNGVFSINDVIGPDEYHIGVNNNFYTNYMVIFCLSYYLTLVRKYGLNIENKTLDKIKDAYNRIKRPNIVNEVIEQFDGYFELEDFTITHYMRNGLPMIPKELEKIIFGFGDLRYNIVKQSDVMMLLSMFPYDFNIQIILKSYDYYEKRTIHESSLSTTHVGIIAGILGIEKDVSKYLKLSSGFNLDFEPKDYYNNGIHYAACAGAWLILLEGVFRLHSTSGLLTIDVNYELLSKIVESATIPFYFKNNRFFISWQGNCLAISNLQSKKFDVYCNNKLISSDDQGVLILS